MWLLTLVIRAFSSNGPAMPAVTSVSFFIFCVTINVTT
jgi:hypothetical protein